MHNNDLCPELALTENELTVNAAAQTYYGVIFDPDYSLSNMSNGFRVLASDDEQWMNERPARS
jgi:hypothetical protein